MTPPIECWSSTELLLLLLIILLLPPPMVLGGGWGCGVMVVKTLQIRRMRKKVSAAIEGADSYQLASFLVFVVCGS